MTILLGAYLMTVLLHFYDNVTLLYFLYETLMNDL